MPSAAWPAPHGKVCVVASSQKCCRLTLPLPLHLVSFDKESKVVTFFLCSQAPLWGLGASWWCERNLYSKYWAAHKHRCLKSAPQAT